jgi:hypothetical protein
MPFPYQPPDVSPAGYREHVIALDCYGYWPLNETSGTTAFNQAGTGSGRDATWAVSQKMDARSVGYQQQEHGEFDGTNQYVECPTAIASAFDNYVSFSTWIRTDAANTTGGNRWIAAMSSTGSNYTWGLSIRTGNTLRIDIWQDNGAAFMNIEPTKLFVPHRWTHVAWTLNRASPRLRLYVDGEMVGSTTSTSGTVGSAQVTRIGMRPDGAGSKFKGWQAHAAYWSTSATTGELTPEQVHHLWRRGVARTIRQPGRLAAA